MAKRYDIIGVLKTENPGGPMHSMSCSAEIGENVELYIMVGGERIVATFRIEGEIQGKDGKCRCDMRKLLISGCDCGGK